MNWVDNYKETINPDNRHNFIFKDDTDSIIIGASCEHIFETDFRFSDYVLVGKVIYKQGLDIVLEINIEPENVKEIGRHSVITINLTPADTSLFKQTFLDTYVQLRIMTVNHEVLYDDPHKIVVNEPLVVERVVY